MLYANPIHTLGEYSRLSHEGYRKTIELPEGKNVVPFRSDTVRLVQNGYSFHGLWSENPNQHLKKDCKTPKLNLDVPITSRIDLWLQVQIYYERIDHTLKRIMDYAAKGRLRKISAEKDWPSIDELARYEEEGWNDPFFLEEESLDYENPDLKQLLGVMECKVGTLTEKAISLMRRSERIFGMSSNMMRVTP
nr:MAK10-like protein [Tanacetum cinerariifolium]